MSLLAIGGFNLLCYWAGTGAELWEQIGTRVSLSREIAQMWIKDGAKEHEKIKKVLEMVNDLQKKTPTIISEIEKKHLIQIINDCEAPVHVLAEISDSAKNNPHGQVFINQSCCAIEDVLTLAEEIIKRLPGESEESAKQYTKHVDDCLLNVTSFQ